MSVLDREVRPAGTLTPDPRQFAREEGLLPSLQVAEELIEKHFGPQPRLDYAVEADPEGSDTWIRISFDASGMADVLDRYDAFTEAWVERVAWPERDRICVAWDSA